ncbi:MAG: carbamoyltransferase HypF [Sporichthyaceae bacterium]
MTGRARVRYRVTGVVQGVGFRPFVYVTATRLGLTGSVGNDRSGVVAEVEGDPAAVAALGVALRAEAPALAVVESVNSEPLRPLGGSGFVIADTDHAPGAAVRTLAGPDVATCPDCLRELADPGDRRFRHPFISCTSCGPRFTIIRSLPYDRPTTTMAGFPMCAACRSEYADPADRRFHAQPIACHDCGPTLELVRPGHGALVRDDALRETRRLLRDGAIVAVKGLGGYHLACDAMNAGAVAELRRRKRRGAKPFAVMVRDLAAARRLAHLDDVEAALLTDSRRPIVLLARRTDHEADTVAADVAPRSPDLGMLLPYTPLHTLLLGPGDDGTPDHLVMTSGNLGGEPLAYRDDDALDRLEPLVDAWLRHDRPIHVPVDDSVTRVVDGREAPVRRSRGYAPLPIALPVEVPPMLAVGADLKNTCAVAEGRYAWLSQHVGDMDDLATLEAFDVSRGHLEALVGVSPRRLVADAHPSYRSSGWARRHLAGRELRTVQHHHAHVAAVMAEHGLDGTEPVIGVAFDGTGYGTDGAIWGGELLVADYKGFRRAAHLAYVPLPGGDASVHRPYRMALAHLWAAGVPWDDDLAPVRACPAEERAVLAHQLRSGFGTAPTSSMGRLFDAVSSLCDLRQVVDYEAEAAIELEGAARGVPVDSGYAFGLTDDAGAVLADAAPVVRAVVADRRAGVDVATVAARFHAAVAGLVTGLARRERDRSGLSVVALGGGVFGNALLLSAGRRGLQQDGFTVLSAERVPANDGGIALGQLMVAAS